MTKEELKQLRTQSGMSRQELEQLVGLKGSQPGQRIYDYESGRKGITPAMATLFKLIFEKAKT